MILLLFFQPLNYDKFKKHLTKQMKKINIHAEVKNEKES